MSKQKILSIVLIVGILGGLFLFRDTSYEIKNINSEGNAVVAFGDSLVEGVGATSGKGFVSLLSLSVGEPIINLGVRGDTTAKALLRIDDVLKENPKVVLVLLGGNDFLQRVPKEELFSNLREIVTRIQDSGSAVIILGVQGGLIRDNFDEYYEDLARELQAGYVPNVLDGILRNNAYLSDPIHPNDAGYQRIAEKVAPTLRKVLGR